MEHEQAEQLLAEIQKLTSSPQFRNFVAQSHSRAILQHLKADPLQWPRYSAEVDKDLLYTAHLLFWQGLQLRATADYEKSGDNLIKQGAEILEFLFSEGINQTPESLDQLVNAALGYYISGHYARAFVLMKDLGENFELPQESQLIRQLFLKDLKAVRYLIGGVLGEERFSDAAITAALRNGEANESEALDSILKISLFRALSYFIEFPKNGSRRYLDRTREILDQGIDLAEKVRFVKWWWLFYCAKYLVNEFDINSLWTQLRPLGGDEAGNRLVDLYIRTGYHHVPPILEMWRSQAIALPRVNEEERRSYCLKMPTSAGKTRVAELAILRFLIDSSDQPETKCIYIAPFRSLAVEIESSLRQSFHPLGIRVSELYGGFELSPIERLLMEKTRIIVATPEKVDAFLRYNPEFAPQVRLVIVDEGHIIGPSERGLRFEWFLHRLITRFAHQNVRFFFLSAVLPNIDQFATWITGDPNNVIYSDWRPSRLILGELRWNGRLASIEYTHSGHEPLEHECYVSSFIRPVEGEQLRGSHRRNPYPNDMREAIAEAALRFAEQDMTLVFVAQKRSVEPFGKQLLEAMQLKNSLAQRDGKEFHLPVSEEKQILLDECITLARETMGNDSDMVTYLQAGFVVHHAGIPQRLRIKLEQLVRQQAVRLVVATTTLAQGVNFPIRTVIVYSLWHGEGQPLTPLNFWNICGRAGRGMKENEGQILFATYLADADPALRVDRTSAGILKRRAEIRKQRRTEDLRQEIIEGYDSYRVISALLLLLQDVVQQWSISHPDVNVNELCQLLSENNLDWITNDERENISARLDFLDGQLIAFTEEQTAEEISPDVLQTLLQRSLLFLQAQTGREGILTVESANSILFARLQSIRKRFPTRIQRQRFYRLGFQLSDCERVEIDKDILLKLFQTAQGFYQWDPTTRCDFLADVLEIVFSLHELNPESSSLPNNLKEIWHQLWRPLLILWLQGFTPNEMVENEEIRSLTTSPAEASIFIDDLFGYRAPWGLSAITVYLRSIAEENGQDIPAITNYFSALVKYGVHSPIASSLLAFGIETRRLALKLAEQCSDESMEPQQLYDWFIGLNPVELAPLNFGNDEIEAITEAQQIARQLTNMVPMRRNHWTISIHVPTPVVSKMHIGESIVMQSRTDTGTKNIELYSLWGDNLGIYTLPFNVPPAWSSPDQIEVTVSDRAVEEEGSLITIKINEV